MYELKHGDITLLLSPKDGVYYLHDFTYGNVTFNNMNQYAERKINENDGRESVGLYIYVKEKLKEIFESQLSEYISANIHNYDMYTIVDSSGGLTFYKKNSYLFGEDMNDPDVFIHDLTFLLEGIIVIKINNRFLNYNFIKNTVTMNSCESNKTSPLDIYYNFSVNVLLANEQYKNGIAPPAYCEIVSMIQFLQNKKSIKIILKNGKSYVLKPTYGPVSFGQIFGISSKTGKINLYLNDYHAYRPRLPGRLEIEELDYIQYGRQIKRLDLSRFS